MSNEYYLLFIVFVIVIIHELDKLINKQSITNHLKNHQKHCFGFFFFLNIRMLNTDNTIFTLPSSETITTDVMVSENIEQTLSNKKFKDSNNVEYTIDNLAKLNTANTFTKNQRINTSTTGEYIKAFEVYSPNINSTNSILIKLGKASASGKSGFLGYYYDSDNSVNNYMLIAHSGYGIFYRFYRDKVEFDKNLSIPSITLNNTDLQTTLNNCAKLDSANTFTTNQTINGQLTANKLETNNNTVANAIGNNLQTAIRELINESTKIIIPKQQEVNNNYMIKYDNYFRTIPTPIDTAPGQAVAYSDELKMFISLGYNTGKGLYSYDGISWTVMNIPSKPFKAVCWGNAGFVAILYDTSRDTYTSLDGINWTQHAGVLIELSSYVINIKFCNDIYCVLQDSNTEYWQLSIDGVDWNQQTFDYSARWRDIAYGNGRFVVVGEQCKWASSSNSLEWTYGQFPTTSYVIYSVCYGKRGWLALCQTYYYYSTDSTTWTQGTLPYSGIGNYGIYALGRYFVIPSQNDNHIMITYDLINWQNYGTTFYSSHYIPMFGNSVLICPVSGENAIDIYNPSNTLNNTHTILESVYPVGAIYISFRNISPDKLFGFGSWTQIKDRFLYCANSAGSTGGSSTHTHTLSDNGYCKLATHQAGNFVSRERSTPSWNATHRMPTGAYETAPATDSYGQCLGGNTDSAGSIPPYITCYAWYRTA